MNPQEPEFPIQTKVSRSFGQSLFEWIKVIVLALIIALPIRYYIAEPFIVQGASMDPTFSTGQFLVVDRLTYRFEKPERGDVVVFQYPINPHTYYIKRVIGLPGETVVMEEGKVFIINAEYPTGLRLEEPYIDMVHTSMDTLKRVLGPTEYFVMGDNRAQSSDSRLWGAVEKHFIVGRPIVRLLPVTTIDLLPGRYKE